MDKLFENNQVLVLFLGFYYLLMSSKPKKDNQKVIILYLFSFIMGIFNIIDIKIILPILFITLFIYFEFLLDDSYKVKIVNKLIYKILDYLYLLLFKYHIILFLLSMFLVSDKAMNILINIISKDWYIYCYFIDKIPIILNLIGIILIILIAGKISTDVFEFRSYTKIREKLLTFQNFRDFEEIKPSFSDILLDIEDITYFERKNKYTVLSWPFFKHYLYYFGNIKYSITHRGKRKHTFKEKMIFLKRIIENLFEQLKMIIKSPKKLIRGHSTIEMQLYRQLAIETGYSCKYRRKIAEFVYTPILLNGLKKILKGEYEIVSDLRYKKYILSCYLQVVPIFFNKIQYPSIKSFWGKEWYNLSDGEFILTIICLSKTVNTETPYEVLTNIYGFIESYMSKKEYHQTQKNIKKRINKK